jgi:hypothetical protein
MVPYSLCPPDPDCSMTDFVTETVLKTDEFSETQKGHFPGAPEQPLIRRVLTGLPWWARPIAQVLARREVAALAAAKGIAGVPQLISANREAIVRTWSDGVPLNLARPSEPAFYRDGARILRDLRRAGITHNDLAKAQNWLMTSEGRAQVIDFQLARVHRHRGKLFRLAAYEDFRHLLKQKRHFAPSLLTPRGWRIVNQRSLPSLFWRATGKRLYVAVTRGLFDWSDGEGLGGRAERDGPVTEAALLAQPGVRAVVLVPFARTGRLAGLYAFCEAEPGTDAAALAVAQRAAGGLADLVQVVDGLPRTPNGSIRQDILLMLAQGRTEGLEQATAGDAALRALAARIAAGRPAIVGTD